MTEILSEELEQAFLRNQLQWWKNWAIHQTCCAVLCEMNKGVMAHPDDKMWELTKKELEERCEKELLESYQEFLK